MSSTSPKPGDTAFVAYDEAFELQLVSTIARAIAEASNVGDTGLICLRYGETQAALLKVLAVVKDFAARAGADKEGSA